VRAKYPFTPEQLFAYYEVTVLNGGDKSVIGVGIVPEDYKQLRHPVRLAPYVVDVSDNLDLNRAGTSPAMVTMVTMAVASTTRAME